jgi:hypothetical protein
MVTKVYFTFNLKKRAPNKRREKSEKIPKKERLGSTLTIILATHTHTHTHTHAHKHTHTHTHTHTHPVKSSLLTAPQGWRGWRGWWER